MFFFHLLVITALPSCSQTENNKTIIAHPVLIAREKQVSQAGLSPDNSGEIALNSFETRKKEKTWMEWAADCYEFVRCYKMKCKIRLLLLKFNHFIPEKGVTEHRRVRNAGTYRF